ncbi:MAG TPA: hypothetical protein VN924_16755 [Bryobacteraceae bacterium]|nr:hypothetical protein [Bryobacteraceae bacterium]
MMWKDEIVEEVRAARDAYAAQFDYDLARIFEDLNNGEAQRPERVVDLRPLKRRLQAELPEADLPTAAPA